MGEGMAQKIEEKISLIELEREVENIRKKVFIYETLQAEKEIKEGKVKGPFKRGKDILSKNV